MARTENDIERDFYALAKASALGRAVRGGVYRRGMRPAGSAAEDLTVGFLSGLDGDVQTGIVVLRVYVPDVTAADGRQYPDKGRIGQLQRLVQELVDEIPRTTAYCVATDGTPTTERDEDIKQHFVYARLKFKCYE